MNKVIRTAGLLCLMATALSCGGGNNRNTATETRSDTVTQRFRGLLPAADGPGIRYDLTFVNKSGNTDGDYAMEMTYVEAENGVDMSYNTVGRWQTVDNAPADRTGTTYRLINTQNNPDTIYMLYMIDSMRFLDRNRQPIETSLNYTLTRVR